MMRMFDAGHQYTYNSTSRRNYTMLHQIVQIIDDNTLLRVPPLLAFAVVLLPA